jgi:hypothetical protein
MPHNGTITQLCCDDTRPRGVEPAGDGHDNRHRPLETPRANQSGGPVSDCAQARRARLSFDLIETCAGLLAQQFEVALQFDNRLLLLGPKPVDVLADFGEVPPDRFDPCCRAPAASPPCPATR